MENKSKNPKRNLMLSRILMKKSFIKVKINNKIRNQKKKTKKEKLSSRLLSKLLSTNLWLKDTPMKIFVTISPIAISNSSQSLKL